MTVAEQQIISAVESAKEAPRPDGLAKTIGGDVATINRAIRHLVFKGILEVTINRRLRLGIQSMKRYNDGVSVTLEMLRQLYTSDEAICDFVDQLISSLRFVPPSGRWHDRYFIAALYDTFASISGEEWDYPTFAAALVAARSKLELSRFDLVESLSTKQQEICRRSAIHYLGAVFHTVEFFNR